MKRVTIISCILIGYLSAGFGYFSWADQVMSASAPFVAPVVKGVSTNPEEELPQTSAILTPYPVLSRPSNPSIRAKEYVLYNAESGKVLFRSEELPPVPIASTTKLMTAYLASESADLSEVVTISPEAANQIGSRMGLISNEKITVNNLIAGLLLVSGNDAAYALAEHIGAKLLNNPTVSSDEKVKRFVQEMNSTAKQLYLTETRYLDPAGLNDTGQSTAWELAKLLIVVQQNQTVARYMATATTTVYDTQQYYRHELRNSNRLVSETPYEGILGGKTGYTPDAGHCLITSARRSGTTLVAAILHTDSDTAEASAIEARKLLDFGFSIIQWE